jgi:hypothetical protein
MPRRLCRCSAKEKVIAHAVNIRNLFTRFEKESDVV